jgi:hypothetical protein
VGADLTDEDVENLVRSAAEGIGLEVSVKAAVEAEVASENKVD